MDVAVQIVWWIGLAGALLLTLAVLKAVALVLKALRDICRLAQMTSQAAHGLADNAQAVRGLPELDVASHELTERIDALAAAVRSLPISREATGAVARGMGDG